MKPIKLRIGPDGVVRGLWDDAIGWSALGRVRVERASHVEFDPRRQLWTVQIGQPRGRLRWWLQRLLRRPFGEVVYGSRQRSQALAWEQEYFTPGGLGWSARYRSPGRSKGGRRARLPRF